MLAQRLNALVRAQRLGSIEATLARAHAGTPRCDAATASRPPRGSCGGRDFTGPPVAAVRRSRASNRRCSTAEPRALAFEALVASARITPVPRLLGRRKRGCHVAH